MRNRMLGRSWRSVAPPVAVAVIVLGLGVWPTYQSLDDAEARRLSAQAELEELQVRRALLASIAEEADVLESQLIALDELVPGDYDIAGFIVELDTIADDLGIRLRDVVPAQSADDDTPDAGTPRGWSSVALNVRIVGSYVDLIDFVEATTRTDRLAVIDSITITTSHLGALDATIALRLFRNDRPADDLIARYVETRSDAVDRESQP